MLQSTSSAVIMPFRKSRRLCAPKDQSVHRSPHYIRTNARSERVMCPLYRAKLLGCSRPIREFVDFPQALMFRSLVAQVQGLKPLWQHLYRESGLVDRL